MHYPVTEAIKRAETVLEQQNKVNLLPTSTISMSSCDHEKKGTLIQHSYQPKKPLLNNLTTPAYNMPSQHTANDNDSVEESSKMQDFQMFYP